MCITITSTKHPNYPLMLLSNRDEFYKRPTEPAHFRPLSDSEKILSPLDLARPEHGTWIGVTTSGKIALLVNYRDVDTEQSMKETSRGVLPLDYLCSTQTDEEWTSSHISDMAIGIGNGNGNGHIDFSKIGGFTLLYGNLKLNSSTGKIDNLNILSNRGHCGKVFSPASAGDTLSVADAIECKETFGLSNSLYNEPWKKVFLGEELVSNLMNSADLNTLSERQLVDKCFQILSNNTYSEAIRKQHDFDKKLLELRNSIFIPPIARGGPKSNCASIGEYYGTRTQTVVLLDKQGNLNYYERNLHSSDTPQVDKPEIVSHYSFNITGESPVCV
ncbi:uncharacterized protein LODBEIA_P08310 [Lodderomyces beijingensis]|uniref:DUF833-domain-containing protein n=1 Tax=Lodderomyces beijingensis TaxID=1775926 RepID=A0ABP0ZGS8_9ASCO